MVLGRHNGRFWDVFGGYSIRFLKRPWGIIERHGNFTMYIPPKMGLGEDDNFVPRKEYKCVG